MSVRSGRPSSTRFAPSHSGASAGSPMSSAMAAMSSRDRMETWRTLRISVPRGYCAETREEAGQDRPAWLSPAMPAKLSSIRSTGPERSEAARSATMPSQTTRPVSWVGARIGTGSAEPEAVERPADLGLRVEVDVDDHAVLVGLQRLQRGELRVQQIGRERSAPCGWTAARRALPCRRACARSAPAPRRSAGCRDTNASAPSRTAPSSRPCGHGCRSVRRAPRATASRSASSSGICADILAMLAGEW